VLSPYLTILRKPGAWTFSAAGTLARLPMSMVTLSIVLLVSAVYGEYALAGRIAAVYVVAQAIAAPQLAVLVDRFGQSRIMRPALAIAAVGLVSLTLLATQHAAEPWLWLSASVAGATVGSVGALVRARWSLVTTTSRELHTAYSLESALDELVFVVGPMLAAFLATQISPTVGLASAVLFSVGGGFWFLSQRRTEPPASGRPPVGERRSAIASAGMVAVALVFVAVGIIFGATDVSTVAFTAELGVGGWAGAILAVFASGSLISGLLTGALHFAGPAWRRFVIGVVVLAVTSSAFVLATTPVVLAVVMFVAGLAIAPSVIAGNAVVQEIVPARSLTEGLTWVGTSIGVGFAVGTSVAGATIDRFGGHAGFIVVVAAAGIATLVAVAAIGTLRSSTLRARTRFEDAAPDTRTPAQTRGVPEGDTTGG